MSVMTFLQPKREGKGRGDIELRGDTTIQASK